MLAIASGNARRAAADPTASLQHQTSPSEGVILFSEVSTQVKPLSSESLDLRVVVLNRQVAPCRCSHYITCRGGGVARRRTHHPRWRSAGGARRRPCPPPPAAAAAPPRLCARRASRRAPGPPPATAAASARRSPRPSAPHRLGPQGCAGEQPFKGQQQDRPLAVARFLALTRLQEAGCQACRPSTYLLVNSAPVHRALLAYFGVTSAAVITAVGHSDKTRSSHRSA